MLTQNHPFQSHDVRRTPNKSWRFLFGARLKRRAFVNPGTALAPQPGPKAVMAPACGLLKKLVAVDHVTTPSLNGGKRRPINLSTAMKKKDGLMIVTKDLKNTVIRINKKLWPTISGMKNNG